MGLARIFVQEHRKFESDGSAQRWMPPFTESVCKSKKHVVPVTESMMTTKNKTRAVLGFRGLYLECLVYGRMFVTCSVCVWFLLVMLRVCWFSVLVVGWCSKGCRVWLFGLDPTGTLMSAVVPSILSWLASRLFIDSDELCCWHMKDWK